MEDGRGKMEEREKVGGRRLKARGRRPKGKGKSGRRRGRELKKCHFFPLSGNLELSIIGQ